MAARTLLTQYEAGEFEAVWRKIRAYPDLDGALRAEVLDVAKATMRRVATNADLLADRLRLRGWRALSAEHCDLRTKPSPKDDAILARIVEISRFPIPPTLLAFWKIVGGINWVWDYRTNEAAPNLGVDLPMDEMDPLCVEPPSVITYLFEEWGDQQESEPASDLARPFRIDLAPDYLHKANISGGMPYAILVPFPGADPVFTDERHALPFVDYLRLAFKWAGFPGLEDHAQREDVQRFVTEFGSGLIPF
jgi:hypothetical protein